MRVRGKIFSVVGIMALVTAVTVAGAIYAIGGMSSSLQQFRNVSQQAFAGEHLNRLVISVVAESRAIYGAGSSEKAAPFAASLRQTLAEIDRTLADWSAIVQPDQRDAFDAMVKRAAEFKVFRLETVRLGLEVSPQAANEQGNTEANRANRKDFQAGIDRITEANHARLEAINAEMDTLASRAITFLVTFAAIGSLFGFAIAVFIGTRMIASPLAAVTEVLTSLAGGELGVAVPARLAKDEVGDLWRTVGRFRAALEAAELMRREQARTEAERRERRRAEMLDVARTFEAEVGGVVTGVGEAAAKVLAAAELLARNASETTRRSASVAAASEQTTANVQSVAGASEELSASIAEIGRQIADASRLIGDTVDETTTAENDVRTLADSASRVGSIVAMIRAIAEQTNLLALNATIEAARAGEAGRGFAVVASEVKMLASQTAKATQDIETQMSAIQHATERTVDKIGEVVRRIRQLDQISGSVAASTTEQDAATGEIARNIQEAASGAALVASDIADVQRAAVQGGEASDDLLRAAKALSGQSTALSSNVGRFLATIRAA
jgi:methyl-accepting chemotaxis protein